jgi:hypothetical protein
MKVFTFVHFMQAIEKVFCLLLAVGALGCKRQSEAAIKRLDIHGFISWHTAWHFAVVGGFGAWIYLRRAFWVHNDNVQVA